MLSFQKLDVDQCAIEFVALAVADNDQVNVNDSGRFGAFAVSAFGRNQPGILTTVLPEERNYESAGQSRCVASRRCKWIESG